ncbi:MAG: hypothetical protein H6650_12010 [Ardenticatenales bacterium]|nr:hypothetical protein [Ardenticatenales bacterium]
MRRRWKYRQHSPHQRPPPHPSPSIAAPTPPPITPPFHLHTVKPPPPLTTITLQPTQKTAIAATNAKQPHPWEPTYTQRARLHQRPPPTHPIGSGGLQPPSPLASCSGVDTAPPSGDGASASLVAHNHKSTTAQHHPPDIQLSTETAPPLPPPQLNGASYRLQPIALDPDNRHGRYVALGASRISDYVAVTSPNFQQAWRAYAAPPAASPPSATRPTPNNHRPHQHPSASRPQKPRHDPPRLETGPHQRPLRTTRRLPVHIPPAASVQQPVSMPIAPYTEVDV